MKATHAGFVPGFAPCYLQLKMRLNDYATALSIQSSNQKLLAGSLNMQRSATLGTTGLKLPVSRLRASLGTQTESQKPGIHRLSLKTHMQRNVRIQAQGEGG
jgi:hypothetical protein